MQSSVQPIVAHGPQGRGDETGDKSTGDPASAVEPEVGPLSVVCRSIEFVSDSLAIVLNPPLDMRSFAAIILQGKDIPA
ncbi:MAG TPA: hypothetical protein VKA15_21585 [Isosphaeraceae bacterium]|nr:hypothetical protein [Isosphaeraceae bacterium]